jgi:hypothetical protein
MHYEINVVFHSRHLFATHPRSITTRSDLEKVEQIFRKKFPSDEGFEISVRRVVTSITEIR